MKHTTTTIFLLIFALSVTAQTTQEESQPPIFLTPGQTVTAKDTAWLLDVKRVDFYERAVQIAITESGGDLMLLELESALNQSGARFDSLYQLHLKTISELKTKIDRGNQLNNGTSYLLTAIAAENEKQLKLLSEMRGDVKRIGKRQFWNKVAWVSAGVVAGACGGYLLNR